jgi:Zn-finger nucleic acid-binding protein
MKCPRCKAELITEEIEGVSVLLCPSCSGIFLHEGELKKITHPTAGDVEYSSLENIDKNRISELLCPVCETEKMVDVNFVSYSDIIMKYCRKCSGLWLDQGELKQINSEIDKLNNDEEPWEHSFRVFLSKLPF